jgi:hypothetical protein
MPQRKVKINPENNPTGLTMAERELAICVIQSIRDSIAKSRKMQRDRNPWRRNWDVDDERESWDRICKAAIEQFAGKRKSEKGVFRLQGFDMQVQDDDMAYVMESLGVS